MSVSVIVTALREARLPVALMGDLVLLNAHSPAVALVEVKVASEAAPIWLGVLLMCLPYILPKVCLKRCL